MVKEKCLFPFRWFLLASHSRVILSVCHCFTLDLEQQQQKRGGGLYGFYGRASSSAAPFCPISDKRYEFPENDFYISLPRLRDWEPLPSGKKGSQQKRTCHLLFVTWDPNVAWFRVTVGKVNEVLSPVNSILFFFSFFATNDKKKRHVFHSLCYSAGPCLFIQRTAFGFFGL